MSWTTIWMLIWKTLMNWTKMRMRTTMTMTDESARSQPGVLDTSLFTSARKEARIAAAPPVALVVLSHLRWDFVFQRPQHLLTRMAAYRRVLYVEEPVFDPAAEPHWQCRDVTPNLRVCQLHTNVESPGFCSAFAPHLRAMLSELLRAEALGEGEYVAWLYTPMAYPLLEALAPRAVVYDCMDELSAFLNAPAELATHEASLFAKADLVFTGGPSLYRARLGRHPYLYLFPSSVDTEHFARGRASTRLPLAEPDDQARLRRPRLGFYGVIDERMDRELLAGMADAHPEWEIVLVGPVVKIDPADLPQRANLHYLGARPYADLPAYLAGWDVCLLPFARNAATRFISPTKTLEYMAAERMIVSTPIVDVAEPYGDIVYLGDAVHGFIVACERALAAGPDERARRVARMRTVLARTSWNTTARAMEFLIDRAVERRAGAVPSDSSLAPS
jgi:UDP-galactopyranose mutase